MSLVIDDVHIDKIKTYITKQCDTIDRIISKYVRTMESVIETGIMEGATSEALKVFLDAVETNIADNSANPDLIGSQAERYCTNFIKKVDKADKQIY